MANAAQAPGAECPFCQREVDAELVMYGGKCPYCFGEIPGEEAPTDPGEAKKKAETKALQAKVQRGRLLPLLIVGTVPIVLVCGALGLLLRPTPKMPVLNLDEGEFALAEIGEIVAAPAQVEPPPTEVKPEDKAGTKIAKAPKDPKSPEDVKIASVDPSKIDFGSPGSADPGGTGTRKPTTPTGTGDVALDPTKPLGTTNSAGGLLSGPGISIDRRAQKGVTLTDDNQIIEMAKLVVKEQLPKLRFQCYEPVLKLEPEVAGSWLLNFTVKPDGTVKDVSLAAKEGTTAHTKLETCITQKVAAWPFQPIKAELPVTKSVGFKPS